MEVFFAILFFCVVVFMIALYERHRGVRGSCPKCGGPLALRKGTPQNSPPTAGRQGRRSKRPKSYIAYCPRCEGDGKKKKLGRMGREMSEMKGSEEDK